VRFALWIRLAVVVVGFVLAMTVGSLLGVLLIRRRCRTWSTGCSGTRGSLRGLLVDRKPATSALVVRSFRTGEPSLFFSAWRAAAEQGFRPHSHDDCCLRASAAL
jgi:hypothetical protein